LPMQASSDEQSKYFRKHFDELEERLRNYQPQKKSA